MEENKKIEETGKPEEIQRIKLQRHMWPDEIEKKQLKKSNHRLKTALIICVILAFACGWLFGSFSPIPYFHQIKNTLDSNTAMDSDKKFSEVLKIMSDDWYFASGIDDVSTRLSNQALYGMTTNDEDPHTSYMSSEEVQSFTQSINQNYVGIGVQFISTDGINMIERVFPNSPAEKAGMQAGDIMHAVDGTVIDGMNSSDIAALVQGEEGTDVVIDVIRESETITLTITRAKVSMTAYGKMRTDTEAYLKIYHFGDTTADETVSYLDSFVSSGADSLVIDLRGNGGGYLDSLQKIASCFLPADTVVMRQVYSDGTEETVKTVGGMYDAFKKIVILIDGDTASASEVLTMALKEQRDDVTVIGTTSYGKGTVQITKMFDDGSALKYTVSKWVSPNGVWINDTGIEPDIEVKLHDVLYTSFVQMEDTDTVSADSVSDFVKEVQLSLDYLDYEVDRQDGYFSQATLSAIQQFEKDHDMEQTDVLNPDTYSAIVSAVVADWNSQETHDLQLQKADEVCANE